MSDQKFFQILSWYLLLPHLLSFPHLETFNLEFHINFVSKRMTSNLGPTSGFQTIFIKNIMLKDLVVIYSVYLIHILFILLIGVLSVA